MSNPTDRELIEVLLSGGYLHEGWGIYLRLGPDGMLESRAVQDESWVARPRIFASVPITPGMMQARREAEELFPDLKDVDKHRIQIPEDPFKDPFKDPFA